jgi:membrane protein DedA with SNARE-associated domain
MRFFAPQEVTAVINEFITSYGYLAVFFGTLLEGETVLIAAGFAAHRGLLDWPLVVGVAMAGSTLGDQLAFFLGRWKGAEMIQRFPALAQHAPRLHDLMTRHDTLLILGIRFLYGLRIAGPVLLGSSGISPLRFAALNLIGAALWTVLVSGAGYAFGSAIQTLAPDLRRFEEIVLLSILVIGLLVWLWHLMRRSRKDR